MKKTQLKVEKPDDMPDEIFRLIKLGVKECRLQYQIEELQQELEIVQSEIKTLMNL